MDFAKIFERMRASFRSFEWNAQTVALLTLVCFALVGICMLQRPADVPSMDEMFGGRVLSVSELEPIEAALGNAELASYLIRDGKLLVPSAERSRYYSVLQKANCLPSAFHASTRAALEAPGFLESSRKSSQRMHHAIEQEARAAICAVPGVEDAFVFFDESPGRGFDSDRQLTAVVGVRTLVGKPLDLQAYRAIQNMVLGFRVGLTPDDVTITDLNARRSLRGAINDPTSPECLAIVRDSLESRWRERIGSELSFVPDLRVDVNVVPDETATEAKLVSVAVGIPMNYIVNTATRLNVEQEALVASTQSEVRDRILPLLPQALAKSKSRAVEKFVTVRVFETPSDTHRAKSTWSRVARSPAVVSFLIVALCGSLFLLVVSANRKNDATAAPGLKVYDGGEDPVSDAEATFDADATHQLRAFVDDDPDAAAQTLSDFIDRAS